MIIKLCEIQRRRLLNRSELRRNPSPVRFPSSRFDELSHRTFGQKLVFHISETKVLELRLSISRPRKRIFVVIFGAAEAFNIVYYEAHAIVFALYITSYEGDAVVDAVDTGHSNLRDRAVEVVFEQISGCLQDAIEVSARDSVDEQTHEEALI